MFGRVLLFFLDVCLICWTTFGFVWHVFLGSLSVSEKFGRINLVNMKIDID